MTTFYEDSEKIKESFRESEEEAKKIINDPEKVNEKLKEADALLKKVDGPISKFFEDVELMIGIIKDWITGEYKGIPVGSIVAILGAIIYFVSPVDFIPDFIPGVGYIDDAFVIALVLKQVDSDLQKYKLWKVTTEEI